MHHATPCFGRALGAGIGHHGVEDPAHDQDDQVVDQRQRGGLAEVELAERDLDQFDRNEGRRIAGAAAGHHERLGVDHEAVHEAQQHRDQQHAMHLRQLDRGEHRPARRAVDLGRLIIRVGNRLQPGVAQQRDQAGPVPDVHHDDGGPGVELVRDVIVVDADAVQRRSRAGRCRAGRKSARWCRPRSTESAAAAPGSPGRPRPASPRAASTARPRCRAALRSRGSRPRRTDCATARRRTGCRDRSMGSSNSLNQPTPFQKNWLLPKVSCIE